jgi:hypothetical protein
MTWIDERLEQLRRKTERDRAVFDGADRLFDELWAEVEGRVKEANSKGLRVGTNGFAYERIVWASVIPPLEQPSAKRRELRINLHRESEGISVSGSYQTWTLKIDVCEDGVVCLKHNDKAIVIQEAARLILDPFLFPELKP